MPDLSRSPRERIVYSAVQSIREQGVAATSLRDVVARAEAPWGSLQHYFPGGKEQLVVEALAWAADFAAKRVATVAAELDPPTPSGLLAGLADQWLKEFARDYSRGCPLVGATADIAATSEELREAAAKGFRTWQHAVAAALRRMDVPRGRADALAALMLSSLEGAIVLARVRRSREPIRQVLRELGPMLDAAVG